MNVIKDLLDYNLTIKYIGNNNGVSAGIVRKILKEAMSQYSEQVRYYRE